MGSQGSNTSQTYTRQAPQSLYCHSNHQEYLLDWNCVHSLSDILSHSFQFQDLLTAVPSLIVVTLSAPCCVFVVVLLLYSQGSRVAPGFLGFPIALYFLSGSRNSSNLLLSSLWSFLWPGEAPSSVTSPQLIEPLWCLSFQRSTCPQNLGEHVFIGKN